MRLTILGAVQGVGFRPFVYRLAKELNLFGWVNNSAGGVLIEVEGESAALETFRQRILPEKPPRSHIYSIETSWLDPVNYETFEIKPSVGGEKTAVVLPDIATCPDCLKEIFDPDNRRYRYPFTNCTNCGPRYSIILALPYDRNRTTMKGFRMCPQCLQEYENPLDRRFHAQPNSCPVCGPHLELWDSKGKVLASGDRALVATAEAIKEGKIVAIKGMGGFHLMVAARNSIAVNQLRECKRRSQKPFALMYPSLELLKADCRVSWQEERLLTSPEAPIVLLKNKSFIEAVAPDNPYLGAMLPYTPLHHLLMAELGFAVVATSGNFSDEPICTDEREALQKLHQIAELFLVHDRPIARPIDDSIARTMMGRELILRRARGYAPLPISIGQKPSPFAPIALGGHLKNTCAIAVRNRVSIGQHIGDLTTTPAFEAFQKAIASLKDLYEFKPNVIACDAHPDYLSTQFAQQQGLPLIRVQHHYAHVLSCMAENELEPPVLGIAWDGSGYGLDGTIWGGEFLQIKPNTWQRIAHMRSFKLPGGMQAVKEPRRAAMGLLYEVFGDELFRHEYLPTLRAFSVQELKIIKTMLHRHLNAPITSSAGRLFDAISSLLGIRQIATFEGQAAMELEFALPTLTTEETYPFNILNSANIPVIIDWSVMVQAILNDFYFGIPVATISAKFHNTLVEMMVEIAKRAGEESIVLTGGCFQNKYLTERAIDRLRQENFRPYWHQRIPPNDGGIALGQILAVFRERK